MVLGDGRRGIRAVMMELYGDDDDNAVAAEQGR
jgi:hypothetical protein